MATLRGQENRQRIADLFSIRRREPFFVMVALMLALWHTPLQADGESPWQTFTTLALQADSAEAFEEAATLFQRIHQAGTALEPENSHLIWSVARLASFHRRQHTLRQAETYQTHLLHLLEKRYGPFDLLLVNSLSELADIQFAQGRLPLSRQTLERALAIVEERTNPTHLLVVRILEQLVAVNRAQDNLQAVKQQQQRVFEIQEQVVLMETPGDAIVLARQARQQLQEGKKESAASLFRQSKDILMESTGPYHSIRVEVLTALADLVYGEGDYPQSVELLKSGLAISENMRGVKHPDLVPLLSKLAMGYQKMGKSNQSRPIILRTLSLVEELYGKDHEKTAEMLLAMADNLRIEGQPDPAVDFYTRAMVVFRRQDSGLGLAKTLVGLARTQQMQGRTGAAVRSHQEALDMIEKQLGTDHPEYVTAYREQVKLAVELNEQEEAARANFAEFIRQFKIMRAHLLALSSSQTDPESTPVPMLP